MASSDNVSLSCSISIEWMNGNIPTRKLNFKKADVRLTRNNFREIFVEIHGDKGSSIKKFCLKAFVVHKKFMSEGKTTIVFQEDNVRVLMSNAPPSQLLMFLRTMYIKVSGHNVEKVSLKEKLSQPKSATEEISPLTIKELRNAEEQFASNRSKNPTVTPPTGFVKKRPASLVDKTVKRRCLSQEIMVPLTSEQDAVLKAAVSGQNIFFTGSAGTGKSFLLRRVIAALPPETTVPTASTGVAACHIGGFTLHAFAGIGTGNGSLKRCIELARRPHVAQLWRKCQVLIIDEISMVDGDFFDKLEHVAREVRNNDRPFGGIRLILCGDFLQLPPVSRSESGSESKAKFCFQSEAWDRCKLTCYELKTVHRQNDPNFINILQNIRIGRVTPDIVDRLMATANHNLSASGIIASQLCSLTKEAQSINSLKLEQLTSIVKEFKAIDSDPYLTNNLDNQTPAESLLKLKVGAQVMLLKNVSLADGLANGARGVVVRFAPEGLPVVRFLSGEHIIKHEKWSVRMLGGTLVSRKQIPLKLAWAFSIHKSQGLTLDCVEMSLGRVFEAGQAYVALSRAKCLASLKVIDFDPKHVWANPDVLLFYQRLRRTMAAMELIPLGRSQEREKKCMKFFEVSSAEIHFAVSPVHPNFQYHQEMHPFGGILEMGW